MGSQQNHQSDHKGHRNQILKIQAGYELNLNVSTDISCGQSFMNPAYRQAEQAVQEIIRQTKRFHGYTQECGCRSSMKESLDDLLFQFSGNIIAFVAPRGGGKTRTMLSFARCLKENGSKKDCLVLDGTCTCKDCDSSKCNMCSSNLDNCKFFTCTPISPATLEDKQNILYVVLSRLYNLAEELLDNDHCGPRICERDKSELYKAFRQCLSGINGIKFKQDKLSDFSILQEIGDGLTLKRRFFELLQILLKVKFPNQSSSERYLVLQLDDTDSQVENCYDVFEDVRKYLLIPNLIILISTDLDLMHNEILQNHLKHYGALLETDKKEYLVADLNRTTRKYIDKLIPPSHMVHLPQLYKVMEASTHSLILRYVHEKNVPVFSWMKDNGDWTLQDAVLSMIYRKTGVLFVTPTTYLHNIIPRTMRGLNQLLYLLKAMDHDLLPLREKDFADSVTFAEAILRRRCVAERNLTRFAEYFTDTWVKAKIRNVKDAEFLKRFCETAANNRVRLAIQYLFLKYDIDKMELPPYTRYALDELMARLDQEHRTQDDFLLIFAIRTLFTLETHRYVWKYRGMQAEQWLKKEHDSNDVLFFDLDPEQIYSQDIIRCSKYHAEIDLDDTTSADDKSSNKNLSGDNPSSSQEETPAAKSSEADALFFTILFDDILDKEALNHLSRYSLRVLIRPNDYKSNVVFNLFNCFNLPLCLSKLHDQFNKRTGQTLTQQQAYWSQELSLLVVANWDVQAKLYKDVNVFDGVNLQDRGNNPGEKISLLVNSVFKMVKEFNNGKLEFVSPELWMVLADPQQSYLGFKNLMNESVYDFEKLKAVLPSNHRIDALLTALNKSVTSSSTQHPETSVGNSTLSNTPVVPDKLDLLVQTQLQDTLHLIYEMQKVIEAKLSDLYAALDNASKTESPEIREQVIRLRQSLDSLKRHVSSQQGELTKAKKKPIPQQLISLRRIKINLEMYFNNISDLEGKILKL